MSSLGTKLAVCASLALGADGFVLTPKTWASQCHRSARAADVVAVLPPAAGIGLPVQAPAIHFVQQAATAAPVTPPTARSSGVFPETDLGTSNLLAVFGQKEFTGYKNRDR